MTDPSAATKPFPSLLARGKRWDHLELLERIDATGSISTAAGAMGMSYKAAWQAIETLNNLAGAPLVEKVVGGNKGGGTRLTTTGEEVLNLADELTRARAELVRIERARGRTIYAIAQELGVTQNAVRRMLGLRGD